LGSKRKTFFGVESLAGLGNNILVSFLVKMYTLYQRFSTWGTRTPRGTSGGHGGYSKKTHYNKSFLRRIFYLGVREEDASLIWGYAEGYNFDVGVREYQKVENHCTTYIIVRIKKKVFCKVFLTHTHLRPHPPPTIAVYPNCKPLLYLTLSTDLNLFVSFDKMFEIKFSFRIPILFWPNILLGKPTLRCSESTKHFPQLKQTRRNLIYGKNGKIVKW
jgi:hypothetical protein